MPRYHPYRQDLLEKSRTLRHRPTFAESRLWYGCLRRLPTRFTRQKPLGDFVVDFYCAKHQLAIEVDGDTHFNPQAQAYDRRRSAALSAMGVSLLRFSNREVMQQFEAVCGRIAQAIEAQSPRAAAPRRPPLSRG